ncbi:MAG: type II 3-dehydroquinate dehydratase [Myxococcota bacterium]|nr:type II 3-dehydroquinate dehydratase [Myxococcota bacterium]
MARILVIHGPNLNLLGRREPTIYGSQTLAAIDERLAELATQRGHHLTCRQSNHEGELITWIQEAAGEVDLLLLNPGGYTHTSVALRDALLATGLRTIEVHVSNPHGREPFRHRSLIAGVVQARVMGFGWRSYEVALLGGLSWIEADEGAPPPENAGAPH